MSALLKLRKGTDAGGVRWFLGKTPLHAGTMIVLVNEARNESVPVRFETSGGDAVLYGKVAGHSFTARPESWWTFRLMEDW